MNPIPLIGFILVFTGIAILIYDKFLRTKVYCDQCKHYKVEKNRLIKTCTCKCDTYIPSSPIAPGHVEESIVGIWENRDNHCRHYEAKNEKDK